MTMRSVWFIFFVLLTRGSYSTRRQDKIDTCRQPKCLLVYPSRSHTRELIQYMPLQTMRKELHEAWAQTLEETLALRASAEPDPARWLHLVDDEVVLVHPITPYRSYRKADVIDNRVVLMGVSDIIADAASLQVSHMKLSSYISIACNPTSPCA